MNPETISKIKAWSVIIGLVVLLFIFLNFKPGDYLRNVAVENSRALTIEAIVQQYQAVLSQIQAATSIQQASTLAIAGGLHVNSTTDPADGLEYAIISYPGDGTVLAVLKVYGDNFTTTAPACTLSISYNPTTVPYNGSLTVSYSGTNVDNNSVQYSFDGRAYAPVSPFPDSKVQSNLTSVGFHNIILKGQNSAGDTCYSNTASYTVEPQAPACTLSISYNPTTVPYNGSLTVSYSGTNVNNSTVQYNFDNKGYFPVSPFPDSKVQSNLTSVGTHNIILKGQNSAGDACYSNTASYTVEPQAPACTLSISYNPTTVPYNGSLTVSYSGTNVNNSTVQYNFDNKGYFPVSPFPDSKVQSNLTSVGTHNIILKGQNSAGDTCYSNTASYTVNPQTSMFTPPAWMKEFSFNNLFAPLIAYAQSSGATVTGNTTGKLSECFVPGTEGNFTKVIVTADGHPHGILGGNYNFSVTCNWGYGVANCADSTSAAHLGQTFVQALGGPQSTLTTSPNEIEVVLLGDDFMALGGIAIAQDTLQPDGTFKHKCKITVNAGSPSQTVQNIVEHEMLHCFGLGHSNDPINIMNSRIGTLLGTDQQAFLHNISNNQTINVINCKPVCGPGMAAVGSLCLSQSFLCGRPGDVPNSIYNETTLTCQPCPANTTANLSTGSCDPELVCPGDTVEDSNGECFCPDGTIDGPNDTCVIDCSDPINEEDPSCLVCPGDTVEDASGDCVCPDGTIDGPNDTCVPDCFDPINFEYPSCLVCPGDTVEDINGECFCPDGTIDGPFDTCVPDTDYCAQNPTDIGCPYYCEFNWDEDYCSGGGMGGDENVPLNDGLCELEAMHPPLNPTINCLFE